MKGILTEPRIHNDFAEFYSLWRDACIGKKSSEMEEIKFLLDIFASSSNLNSILDLGGSVGLHSIALHKHGFEVTLLDKSETALAIAKRSWPDLQTLNSSFENLTLSQNYDASICMYSSMNYLLDADGRTNFYHALSTHTNDLVILDQINVHRLRQNL